MEQFIFKKKEKNLTSTHQNKKKSHLTIMKAFVRNFKYGIFDVFLMIANEFIICTLREFQ